MAEIDYNETETVLFWTEDLQMEEDPTMQRAWRYPWRRVVAWSALSALVAITGLTLAALGAGRGGK